MAWAFILSAAAAPASGDSATTAAVNMTGADTFVVIASGYTGVNAGSFTCSDSSSNSYSSIAVYDNGGSAVKVQMFYVFGATATSSMTFTVSSASSHSSIAVFGFSGGSTGTFDTSNQHGDSGTTGTPGSITPAQNDELFVVGTAWIGAGFASRTFDSVDSSFVPATTTAASTAGYISGENFGVGGAYKIKVASTSAENPTLTYSGSSGPVQQMVALKPGAGGGGGGATPHFLGLLGSGS